jgi:hypothetical protein
MPLDKDERRARWAFALEVVLVTLVFVALIAMVIWFLFFAGSPI